MGRKMFFGGRFPCPSPSPFHSYSYITNTKEHYYEILAIVLGNLALLKIFLSIKGMAGRVKKRHQRYYILIPIFDSCKKIIH